MLTEKCRNQEEIIADLELREQEHQELEAESELLRQQVNATRYNVLKVDLLLLLLIHITKLKQTELDLLLSLNNIKIYTWSAILADDFTAIRVEIDDIYPGGVGDSLEETNQFVYMYKSEEVPLVEFMYLVCTHMPHELF